MSDYVEITLDPSGVRPAWLEDGDDYSWLYPPNAVFSRSSGFIAGPVPNGWRGITKVSILKNSPAYARYLASKKPEAPALPVTVELMAEIERVITNGANGKDVWPDECRAILAALNPPEVDPLDEIMREKGVSRGVREEVIAEVKSRGLTITEARHVGD